MGIMSCTNMEGRILGYVDGRLKDSERLEMEKHLAGCVACSVRVKEFRSVSALLDEMPVVEPSAAFDVRVRARMAAEPVQQSWWAWLRPSPRIAFAASMLLLATVWLGYNSHNVSPLPITPEDADASVMEDHDSLANFEPLKALPAPVDTEDSDQQM